MWSDVASGARYRRTDQTRYPITAPACVDVVVTDLAVLRRTDGQWRIEQVADGFTADEIQSLTELELTLPSRV